jgi:putative ABC transport system permease protein
MALETGPILRAVLRNKTGPVLIALQIALTLAVLVNAVFIIQGRVAKIARDTGMDVDNIITVQSVGIADDFDVASSVRQDLAALEAMPGVVAATAAQHVPLSGSGWGTEMKASEEPDAPRENAVQYFVSERGLEALGVTLESGRGFTADDVEYPTTFGDPPDSVIITRAYADALFPDGGAQPGVTLYSGLNDPVTVIGIVERMHGAWVSWDKLEHVMLVPTVLPIGRVYYLIRTEPGERDRLMPRVEEMLAGLDDRRLVRDLKTHSEYKADSYRGDSGMAVLLTVVVGLMVAITGVGIVGLASFSVRQRVRQIGTRRALGARRSAIIRYFMLENWLITTAGVAVGTAGAFGLNAWLVSSHELERLDPFYVPAGILCLWLLGLAAVVWPARRAAAISPAVATRTV